MGDIRLRQNRPQDAKSFFERAARLAPKDPRPHARLGLIYRALKDNSRAMDELNKALEIDPKLSDVLSLMASIEIQNKNPKKAVELVQAQISKQPENAQFQVLLGDVYRATGDLNSAEASFRKAIELKSDLTIAYMELGNLYYAKGSFDEAIRQFTEAAAKSPKQTAPHMILGVLYEKQGKFKEAEEHYRKVLDVNPKFVPAANNLAWILSENNGNLDVALTFAETAKEAQPDDPRISDTLGWIYYKKQAYLKSVSYLKGAVAKLPDSATVRYHLGMAYFKKGDKKPARQELSKS